MAGLHPLLCFGLFDAARRALGAGLLSASLMIAGCAHQAAPASALPLLHDELFPAAQAAFDPAAVFELSEPMRRYAAVALAKGGGLLRDPRRNLIDALYRDGQLRLSYDSSYTRNAAEAFEARAGNCLSLVVMTAAFARHLDLPVTYQSVSTEALHSRSGEMVFSSGHINLVLGRIPQRTMSTTHGSDELTVDFLPPAEVRTQRTETLDERTVVAMYLNNRAAETLAEGHLAESYGWVRAAIAHQPGLDAAINTLAVIYLRAGHLQAAEAALQHLLTRSPEHLGALSNLALLLRRDGRQAQAQAVSERLARLQPVAPFQAYEQGRAAMAEGAYGKARSLFAAELQRQPEQPEVHFWAAQAALRLGDAAQAAVHLRAAAQHSTTAGAQALYATKLAHLRTLGVR